MIVLGIESSSDGVGVVIARDGAVVAQRYHAIGRRHVELIAPTVEQLLGEAGLTLGDLNAVAVDVGPGLFTGLRVGVSAANALAFAAGLPVIAVHSVDIVAGAVPCRLGARLCATLDARRGEVFCGWFEAKGGAWVQSGPTRVARPGEIVEAIAAQAGPVILAVPDGLAPRFEVVGDVQVAPYAGLCLETFAALAHRRWSTDDAAPSRTRAVPSYGRGADIHSHEYVLVPTSKAG